MCNFLARPAHNDCTPPKRGHACSRQKTTFSGPGFQGRALHELCAAPWLPGLPLTSFHQATV
eukprot:638211-Karenia_brevis.AAC.1